MPHRVPLLDELEPTVDRRTRLLRQERSGVGGCDGACGLQREEPRYARGSFRRDGGTASAELLRLLSCERARRR